MAAKVTINLLKMADCRLVLLDSRYSQILCPDLSICLCTCLSGILAAVNDGSGEATVFYLEYMARLQVYIIYFQTHCVNQCDFGFDLFFSFSFPVIF